MNLPYLSNLSPILLKLMFSQQPLHTFANGYFYSHHVLFLIVVAYQILRIFLDLPPMPFPCEDFSIPQADVSSLLFEIQYFVPFVSFLCYITRPSFI